jgi:hypothetical protein
MPRSRFLSSYDDGFIRGSAHKMDPLWQQSEDSFLRHCCEIRKSAWGHVYWWPANIDNPKLNFVRLELPNLIYSDFLEIEHEYRPFFESKMLTFWIKVPQSVSLLSEIGTKLKPRGTAIVYLRTERARKPIQTNGVDARKCTSEKEFRQWWLIFSTYPTEREKLNSPFMPVALEAFRSGTEFYLLLKEGRPVSTLAIDRFGANRQHLNLWGAATNEQDRRKGYYLMLENLVLGSEKREIFMQVNENSPLHLYNMKFLDTHRLESVNCFVA